MQKMACASHMGETPETFNKYIQIIIGLQICHIPLYMDLVLAIKVG